uniref:Uncharacterized protein n=1 Tax=Leersia perrieri TaxID=77586 RepID=A0A0D9X9L5_9ORYZ
MVRLRRAAGFPFLPPFCLSSLPNKTRKTNPIQTLLQTQPFSSDSTAAATTATAAASPTRKQ